MMVSGCRRELKTQMPYWIIVRPGKIGVILSFNRNIVTQGLSVGQALPHKLNRYPRIHDSSRLMLGIHIRVCGFVMRLAAYVFSVFEYHA